MYFSSFADAGIIDDTFSELLESSKETEQNTGVDGKSFNVKKINIELKNINDIGLIFLIDENDNVALVASPEQTLGLAGSETIELEPYLKLGQNLLVFALWNKGGTNIDLKYWNKTFLNSWSFDYTLIGDGTTLYKLHDSKEGKEGITYWNAFLVDSDGATLTLRPIAKSNIPKIKQAMQQATNTIKSIKTDLKTSDIASNIAISLRLAE